jgi:DNA transformation protein
MKQSLLNLGPVSWKMLERAGFKDIESVRAVGPVRTYLAVKDVEKKASLNLLYALAAGLQGRRWSDLTPHEKGRLIRELEDLRESRSQGGA